MARWVRWPWQKNGEAQPRSDWRGQGAAPALTGALQQLQWGARCDLSSLGMNIVCRPCVEQHIWQAPRSLRIIENCVEAPKPAELDGILEEHSGHIIFLGRNRSQGDYLLTAPKYEERELDGSTLPRSR